MAIATKLNAPKKRFIAYKSRNIVVFYSNALYISTTVGLKL